jgi:hypothetical protein
MAHVCDSEHGFSLRQLNGGGGIIVEMTTGSASARRHPREERSPAP